MPCRHQACEAHCVALHMPLPLLSPPRLLSSPPPLQDVMVTALDNLAARQYVDARARWFSLPYVQVGGSLCPPPSCLR